MGRRHYKRHRIELPVTVSGLDTRDNPFTQSATTVEISAHGLHLRGISCLRAAGDPVQVKYKRRGAAYRVAWIGDPGTSLQGLVGLECQEDARRLFDDVALDIARHLDFYVVASETAPEPVRAVPQAAERPREERRRHQRFNCAGTAWVWENSEECVVADG